MCKNREMFGFFFATSCQPEVEQENLRYLGNRVPDVMQKLNYSWNQIILSLWFCKRGFLCTGNTCSGSLKGFLSLCSHHHSCTCLPTCRVEWQSLLTTPPLTFSIGKTLPKERAGYLPEMPFQESPKWERWVYFRGYYSHETGHAVLQCYQED